MHKVVLVTAGEERLPDGTAEAIREFADFRAKRCETPDELLAAFPDAEGFQLPVTDAGGKGIFAAKQRYVCLCINAGGLARRRSGLSRAAGPNALRRGALALSCVLLGRRAAAGKHPGKQQQAQHSCQYPMHLHIRSPICISDHNKIVHRTWLAPRRGELSQSD